MDRCEVVTLYKVDGKREYRWTIKPVASVPPKSANQPAIRCMHCHGRVKVHKQKSETGLPDHVDHMARRDSEGCRAGTHFVGVHKISEEPVRG